MQDEFSPHRKKLMALAYRMLGSAAEAEDVVQDAYLRWQGAFGVLGIETDGTTIQSVHVVLNPQKLQALGRQLH